MKTPAAIRQGEWFDIRVEFTELEVKVLVNDGQVMVDEDITYDKGLVGFRSQGGTQIFVDDVRVTPLE